MGRTHPMEETASSYGPVLLIFFYSRTALWWVLELCEFRDVRSLLQNQRRTHFSSLRWRYIVTVFKNFSRIQRSRLAATRWMLGLIVLGSQSDAYSLCPSIFHEITGWWLLWSSELNAVFTLVVLKVVVELLCECSGIIPEGPLLL